MATVIPNLIIIGVDLYLIFKDIQIIDWLYEGILPRSIRPPPIEDLKIFPRPMELTHWVTQPHLDSDKLEIQRKKYPELPGPIRDYYGSLLTLIQRGDVLMFDSENSPPDGAVRYQFRGRNTFQDDPRIFWKTVLFELLGVDKNSISYNM